MGVALSDGPMPCSLQQIEIEISSGKLVRVVGIPLPPHTKSGRIKPAQSH
jgi:hypothetical protein